jgi:TatD DNase family protein
MFVNTHTHRESPGTQQIFNAAGHPAGHQWFSDGIHPWDAGKVDGISTELANSWTQPNCLAVGEIGLDKLTDVPFDQQLIIFEQQIEQSEKLGLPVILHCVKAWNEVAQVRKRLKPAQPWIFHGFRKAALLDSVLQEGLLISIGTAILWDEKLQQILPEIPNDKLLLETDSDENYRIEDVYRKVAQLKSLTLPALEKQLLDNFKNTFHKWEIGSSAPNS